MHDCMQISKQATATLSLIFGNDMYARSNVQVAIVVANKLLQQLCQQVVNKLCFYYYTIMFLSCCNKFGTTYQICNELT